MSDFQIATELKETIAWEKVTKKFKTKFLQ